VRRIYMRFFMYHNPNTVEHCHTLEKLQIKLDKIINI